MKCKVSRCLIRFNFTSSSSSFAWFSKSYSWLLTQTHRNEEEQQREESLALKKMLLIIFEFNSNAEHITMCETYLWKCQKSSFLFFCLYMWEFCTEKKSFFLYMEKWCGKVRSKEEVGSDLNTFKPVSNSSSFSQHVWKFFQQKQQNIIVFNTLSRGVFKWNFFFFL